MISIQHRTPPAWAVQVWGDSSGRVFFDVTEDTSIRLTKALDRLSEYDGVTQEAALRTSLALTPKNESLLQSYTPAAMDRQSEVIPVVVTDGDGKRLSVSGATVVSGGEAEPFEVEFFSAAYIDLLERFKVRSLDLGEFDYTSGNVKLSWPDREALAQPLPGHYGGWNTPGDITLKDLRFWFHLPELLRRVFCAIGWSFESPHYDSGEGRHAYAYLSGHYWHTYRNKKAERWVSLNTTAPRDVPANDLQLTLDELHDPFDLYDNGFFPQEYFYGNLDDTPISLLTEVSGLSVTLPPAPPGSVRAYQFFVLLYRRSDNGADLVPLEVVTALGSLDQTVRVTLSFSHTDRDVTPPRSYGFLWGYADPVTGDRSPWRLEAVNVDFRPDPSYYIEGDSIYLADLIDDEITGLELFEAAAHMINGKVLTDEATQTVTLLAPDRYTMQDGTTVIAGFFRRSEPIDLSAYVDPDSIRWATPESKQPRRLILGFAKGDDAYIKLSGRGQYTREIEFPGGQDRKDERLNPLFQPTADIETDGADTGGDGIILPALWDNDEGVVTKDAGPRIGIYYGLIDQGKTWTFDGTSRAPLPYLSQVATAILPASVDFVPLSFRGYVRDLYELFYRSEVERTRSEHEVFFLLAEPGKHYPVIDFRRPLIIPYQGGQLLLQPSALKDYEPGNLTPVLVETRKIKG